MAAAVASQKRLLIKGGTILSMDAGVADFAQGDILVEGEKIAAVGRDLRVDDAEYRLAFPRTGQKSFCRQSFAERW